MNNQNTQHASLEFDADTLAKLDSLFARHVEATGAHCGGGGKDGSAE